MSRSDPTVEDVACPACGRGKGEPCRTVVDGRDTRWTHDARFYAALGVRAR